MNQIAKQMGRVHWHGCIASRPFALQFHLCAGGDVNVFFFYYPKASPLPPAPYLLLASWLACWLMAYWLAGWQAGWLACLQDTDLHIYIYI